MADKKKPSSTEMAERELTKMEAKAIANRMLAIKKIEAQKRKLEKEITKIKSGDLVPDEGSVSVKDEDDESSPSSLKVVVLIDESGSMSSCETATISGFNEYIQKLQKENKNITVTLTKFNSDGVTMAFSNLPVHKVPFLSHENYNPSACTPLYDAIGKTITQDKINKKTLFIIMTDGQENASKEYSLSAIQSLIKEQEKQGWSFVYLGADQDAWGNAHSLGLSHGNVMNYSSHDTTRMYGCLASETVGYSQSKNIATSNFALRLRKRMQK
jgi:hypothetical protein